MVLGAEADNNLLHSELVGFDFTALEERGTALREVLLEKGWADPSRTTVAARRLPQPWHAVRESSVSVVERTKSGRDESPRLGVHDEHA